uniref:Uncharacterized protein n=1 Tax=Klebsiella pneumoniae TaxID=573 RepID=A0A8B0SWY1_KLEPN|nr:hypothetical protein [Klebsiella pneumoniae]
MHSEYMEVYNERFRSQMIRCNSSLFIMIYWKLVKFLYDYEILGLLSSEDNSDKIAITNTTLQ